MVPGQPGTLGKRHPSVVGEGRAAICGDALQKLLER
jgi:hypothetical protein